MKYLLITLISILFTYSLASGENESDLTLIPDTDIVTIVGEGYDIFTISKGKDGSFDVHLIKKNDYIILYTLKEVFLTKIKTRFYNPWKPMYLHPC